MKTFFCLLIAAMLVFSSAHAQDTNSTLENACKGTWELQNYGGWVVRNNEGTVLPLSPTTIFYDCLKNQFQPNQDLHGFEVQVECFLDSEKSNLPEVTKVFFFCK